jgi:hypothetical protein
MAFAADEQDHALALWRAQIQSPSNHAAHASAWRSAERQFSSGGLRPMFRGFAAWHLLKAGATNDATTVLEAMSLGKATHLEQAGAEMARRWLTRLDREKVRLALRAQYQKEVAFPVTIEPLRALPEAQRPPLADRFGSPWQYSIDGFKAIRGTRGQRYRLLSAALGPTSDLAVALARPYGAEATPPKPVRRVSSGAGGEAAFMFEAGAERPVVSVGAKVAGWTLAWASDRMLVMSDGDYWALVAPPAAAP